MDQQLPQTPASPAPGQGTPSAPGYVTSPAQPALGQGTQPGLPAFAFPTGQHNKVHHSYIWLSPLLGLGAALVVGVLTSIEDIVKGFMFAGDAGFSLLLILLFVVLALAVLYGIFVGITALSYKHLSFVFDETEFSLYSGILTKRRVHVPYARVQSVNHKQSPIQRLAGVCTVEIDTAGGASNKAIKVPYVKLDVGEAIRADLFMRKAYSLAAEAGQPMPQFMAPGQAYAPAMAGSNVLDEAARDMGVGDFRGLYGGSFAGLEPISFERRLSNKELLLASISHSSVSGMLAFLFICIAAAVVAMIFFGTEILIYAAFVIPVTFMSLLIAMFFTMATTALSYGSFSVRRRGSRVEVERGILQRDFSGIDVNRIQSVVIRQSLIRKLMGYCEVSLGRIRASSGEEQNTQANLNAGGLVIHPFLKLDQVDGLLNSLLPEYIDRPTSTQFKGLPVVAFRRGILRRCLWRNGMFWFVLLTIVFQIGFNLVFSSATAALGSEGARLVSLLNVSCVLIYLGFIIQVVLIVIGTVWWKRGSGFAMTEKYLALCNDGLGTETVYLPRQKIQDVYTRTNPFQKAAGVTTIGAVTAAGVQGTTSFLWDVTEEDGAAWLDWLKPRTQQQAQIQVPAQP